MWKLPDWYGSLLVALVAATWLSFWAHDPSLSYWIGLVLNVNALVLLIAWNYLPMDEFKTDGVPILTIDPASATTNVNSKKMFFNSKRVDDLEVPPVPVSTLTADSYDDSFHLPDPISDFVTMPPCESSHSSSDSSASSSSASAFIPKSNMPNHPQQQQQPPPTHPAVPAEPRSILLSGGNRSDLELEDNDDDDDFMDGFFCWGFSLYWGLFFLLVLITSGTVSLYSALESSPNYADETNFFYFANLYWTSTSRRQAAFVVSFGMYLAVCCVSYLRSSHLQHFLRTVLGRGHGPRILILLIGLVFAVMSIVAANKGFRARQSWSHQRAANFAPISVTNHEMGYNMSSLYFGEAWTVGDATILDESHVCETRDNDRKFTTQEHNMIPINISVLWGGEWACPSNPDISCESTVQVRVSCFRWNEFRQTMLNPQTDDETENNYVKEDVTLQDYLHFRYHDYAMDDDTAYDRNKEPSYSYWNRPAEWIVGTCDGSCVAQSQSVLSHVQDELTFASHAAYLGLGMSIVFFVWPIYELWRHLQGLDEDFASLHSEEDDDRISSADKEFL